MTSARPVAGEPAVPGFASALANAVFDLTRVRVRRLPVDLMGLRARAPAAGWPQPALEESMLRIQSPLWVAAAATCLPALPPGWAGALLVGHLREADIVQRAGGHSGGAPLTVNQRLSVASLGKMFTAVAIGQLVDAGRTSFDDPIGRHLPALPAEFRALTVAQLLTHTAGLGGHLE